MPNLDILIANPVFTVLIDSFSDFEGIEHAVEVVAASLYQAAVLALAKFPRCGFTDATFGPATRLIVLVGERHQARHSYMARPRMPL